MVIILDSLDPIQLARSNLVAKNFYQVELLYDAKLLLWLQMPEELRMELMGELVTRIVEEYARTHETWPKRTRHGDEDEIGPLVTSELLDELGIPKTKVPRATKLSDFLDKYRFHFGWNGRVSAKMRKAYHLTRDQATRWKSLIDLPEGRPSWKIPAA